MALLKLALMLGVNFHVPVAFADLVTPDKSKTFM